ncbi:MAG: cytochrome c3 family protein [Candidatus Sumerlaeia bacterium]
MHPIRHTRRQTTVTLLIPACLLAAVWLCTVAVPAPAQDTPPAADTTSAASVSDATCLSCHARPDITGVSQRGKGLTLFVDRATLEGSAHKGVACTACHGGAKTFMAVPHNDGRPLELLCSSCHNSEVEQYEKSVHGIWHGRGDEKAASCASCHGAHDILPSSNPASKTYKFNVHKTCGTCHQDTTLLSQRQIGQKEAVEQFVDSIHGRALLTDGLIVAPTCHDCHGAHDILPGEHPDSRIGRDRIPRTCGACHVLVEETYNQSIHGRLYLARDARGPVCNTCHTAHRIIEPTNRAFRFSSDAMCGQCHKDRLENYHETFHGKALALGRDNVAACYDCHGHHDIQKGSDPRSRVSDEQRLQTCRRCHPKANPNFANYIVHADHTNRTEYPILYYAFLFMTALLVGTFAFFAVHTILWLFRSMALFMSDSKDFRLVKFRIRRGEEQYVRFRPLDRFLHGLIIISFLLLVITGMPLKFYYTGWAKWLFSIMGGQNVAAVMHRVGAIITIFYFTVHVASVLVNFFGHKKNYTDPQTGRLSLRQAFRVITGPDSPMPTLQDLKDIIAHNKWFLGKGEKPQFDRWTYWEKFDYLAVFWGVAVIGLSGLIMWIPELFTKVLPGWAINVALIVHSDEALLAAGFIFTFHFFNVHFRPEKFPMDPVIFSGRMSRAELEHERGRLLERWKQSGELERHLVRQQDEWESWKWIALPAGFIAFCIGVVLVVLIFYAMISRLIM